MGSIFVYEPGCKSFANNGLGALTPIETKVHKIVKGVWECTMEHPIDSHNRWALLINEAILKVPVPVRESPDSDIYITPGQTTVTRQIYKVKTTNGERLYMRAKPDLTAPVIGSISYGGEAMLIEQTTSTWWKMESIDGGMSGYMYRQYLDYSRSVTESASHQGQGASAISPASSRYQLFRIYYTEPDTERMTVTVKAMHITYDLRRNPVAARLEYDKADAQQALRECWNALANPHPFTLHYERMTGTVTGNFSYKNACELLLDPDEGFAAQTGCRVVRDNYDIYLIPDYERDRGVTIRRGKNLIGVTSASDTSNVCTTIIPCGKAADGSDLLGDPVTSPFAAHYPEPMTQIVQYDVRVSEDGIKTEAEAKAKLRELALADFEAGADAAKYTLTVDFATLDSVYGDTDYARLQAIYPYDTVTVIDELIRLKTRTRITEYEWDPQAERYTSLSLGDIQDLTQTVYSYNLPTGGISGIKISEGSAPGSILRNLSVDYAKMSNAAIEQLNAQTISAVEATFEKIAAGTVTANNLVAAVAQIVALYVKELKAESISTDRLAAALAQFGVITAGTASFDRETVKHLIASALQVEDAVGDKVFISNLMVDYAAIVNAYVGNLCIKAQDGNYYQLIVSADGTVSAERTNVTAQEQAQGQLSTGQPIIETSMTVSDLSATNLKAVYALINKLDAERIDVGRLTAKTAFIDFLRTADLASNRSIRFALGAIDDATGQLDEIRRYMTFSDDGLTQRVPGSEYYTRVTNSGFDVMYDKQAAPVVSINADNGLETLRITMGTVTCRKTSSGGWVWQ